MGYFRVMRKCCIERSSMCDSRIHQKTKQKETRIQVQGITKDKAETCLKQCQNMGFQAWIEYVQECKDCKKKIITEGTVPVDEPVLCQKCDPEMAMLLDNKYHKGQ